MTDPIVGIDLGTSNTVVAASDEHGQPRVLSDDNGYKIQPSVVSFHPNGSVIVGAEAKQRKIIDPRNTVYSVKRLIGRSYKAPEIALAQERTPFQIKEGVNQQPVIVTRAGEFAIPEISAIVLDHVRNIARRALGADVHRAVITVPANFVEGQRSATATAGAIAGLTVVRVLNEPTAAALAYGHQRQLDRTIAVYDFGGGTFDVTILRLENQVYEVLGTAGDSFLGGDDLDEALVDHMVHGFLQKRRVDLRENEMSMMRLRAVAEQTKIELSRRTRAIVKVDEIAYGPGGAPLHLELEITRDEFVDKVRAVVARTFPVCEEALRLAQLAPGGVDEIVLVGGTTKIPHVRDRVTEFFGKPVRTDVNPEEAVAIGASLQAESLQRVLSGKRQTARTSVAPPGSPLPQRPATDPPPIANPARTTAPRVASEAEATIPRRQTSPMGVPQTRPSTERPVSRGGAVDRIPGSRPGTAPGTASPLARITRPGAAPPPIPLRATQSMPAPAAPFPEETTGTSVDEEITQTRASTDSPTIPEANPTLDDLLPTITPIAPPIAAPGAPTLIQGLTGQAPMPRVQADTMPNPTGPVVLDVTPRGLGIGTVAGYCEELIRRNSRVPTEIKRNFTTSRDKQDTVRIRVCQGESRRIDENLVVGELILDGLEPRGRGETTIEVTFQIDANGILRVRARDARTGREQRANLDVVGAVPTQEVDAARQRLRDLRS